MSYQRLPEHEDGPAAPSAAEAELTPLPSAPPAEEVKKDAACEPEDGLTPVTIMQLGRPNLTFRVRFRARTRGPAGASMRGLGEARTEAAFRESPRPFVDAITACGTNSSGASCDRWISLGRSQT
jgi:hypothetical protein